jgi:hypothetical protein
MEFIKNFFRENTSESMTRACMLIVVVSSCGLAWYCAYTGKNLETLILGMLAMVLTSKVIQKTKE